MLRKTRHSGATVTAPPAVDVKPQATADVNLEAAATINAERMPAEALSAYELQRLKNMEANNAILASLGLVGSPGVSALTGRAAAGTSRPSQRGVGKQSQKRKETPSEPTRKSLRTRSVAPESASIVEEKADGTISGAKSMPRFATLGVLNAGPRV